MVVVVFRQTIAFSFRASLRKIELDLSSSITSGNGGDKSPNSIPSGSDGNGKEADDDDDDSDRMTSPDDEGGRKFAATKKSKNSFRVVVEGISLFDFSILSYKIR